MYRRYENMYRHIDSLYIDIYNSLYIDILFSIFYYYRK